MTYVNIPYFTNNKIYLKEKRIWDIEK